ncbi:hypothetical protein C8R44DRAFT_742217 [Mycena epipterygia]|nr:hypothetical protein C8R44DRAFT_742217 [Mycena epipterygia]
MPAERTRGSRRTGADGTQLVWTQPVAPVGSSGIAFATNLTPTTFADDTATTFKAEPTDAPPPSEPTADTKEEACTPSFFVFEPSTAPAPKRASHKRKPAPAPPSTPSTPSPSADSPPSAEAHIPRPPNAFILFRSAFIRGGAIPAHIEPSHATLSAIAGLTWAALPAPEKSAWHAKAKKEREAHGRRFPGYSFRPKRAPAAAAAKSDTNRGEEDDPGPGSTSAGGGGGKRKQREVPPADRARCAHIASLLVQGLSGPALDAAIGKWDEGRERVGVEVRGRVDEWGGEDEVADDEREQAAGAYHQREQAEGAQDEQAARADHLFAVLPTTRVLVFGLLADLADVPRPLRLRLPLRLLLPIDGAFDWPFDSASPFPPSSPLDSCPASPALSFASSASTSAWASPSSSAWTSPSTSAWSSPRKATSALSACSSLESLGNFDGFGSGAFDFPSTSTSTSASTPAFGLEASFDMSMSCDAMGMGTFDSTAFVDTTAFDMSSMSCPSMDIFPPYDLDLGLGLGLGLDAAYLTGYVECPSGGHGEGGGGQGMWQ